MKTGPRHSLSSQARAGAKGGRRAFTLIELILVMGLLATMMAIAAPHLTGFFSGRTLSEETRRVLALTRFARNEAAARSERLQVWMKPETGVYGVRSDSPYQDNRGAAHEYQLAQKLAFRIDKSALNDQGEATMLFWPDGTIDEGSLGELTITEDGVARKRIALASNHLEYTAENVENEKR